MLDVSGDISANVYNGPGGTAGAPHFTFSDDRTTGLFFPSSGNAAFTTAGAERGRFDVSGLQMTTGTIRNRPGTVAAPSYTFVNDLSMGLYDPSTNVLGIVTSGAERMRVASNGFVGIGTTDPQAVLHINRTGGPSFLRIAGDVSQTQELTFNDTTQRWSMYKPANTTSLRFYDGAADRLTFLNGGTVGIGTTTPSNGLLHVNGTSATSYGSNSFWTGSNSTTILTGAGGSQSVSLFASSFIWSGGGYINTSDQRIKNNISDISDSSALDTMRLVQPKRYGYIDTVRRGSKNVLGFLAQQVESVLPDAVGTGKEFIPNIYDRCECTPGITGTTLVTLETKDVSFIPQTDPSGNAVPTRIKFYNKEDKEAIGTLQSVLGPREFIIEEVLPETQYFAYGQEVNDFKTLNKDAIFTVATAALQEVDRQLQAEKAKTVQLQSQMSNVLVRLTALESA
jgi:hypothetical protein